VIIGVVDEATLDVVGIAAVVIVAVGREIEATGKVVVKCASAQLGEGIATVETSGVIFAAEVVIEVVLFSVEETSDVVVDATAVI
jgi:hypothetical protein